MNSLVLTIAHLTRAIIEAERIGDANLAHALRAERADARVLLAVDRMARVNAA